MWQECLNEYFDNPLTRVTITQKETDKETDRQTDHTRFETWGVPVSFQRNKRTDVYKGKVR